MKKNIAKILITKINKDNLEKIAKIYCFTRKQPDILKIQRNKKIYTLKDIKKWIWYNKKDIVFFLLTINYKVQGIIYYNLKSTKYLIYIKKKFRSKGYSSTLLKKLINYGKRKNLKITADVSLKNKKSLSLHKKFNFRKRGKFRIYTLLNKKIRN